MKKIKTMVIFALVAVQLLGIADVRAVSVENAWKISYYGTFADDTEKYNAEITDASVYDGGKALYVKCPSASKDKQNYIEITNTLKDNLTQNSYTLKFYAKKSNKSVHGEVFVGDKEISVDDMTEIAVTSPNDGSAWKEYSITFDYTGESMNTAGFRFFEKVQSYAIDNVSLIKSGDTANLIDDEGFEDWFDGLNNDVYDRTGYLPANVKSYPGRKQIALIWTNPTSADLRAVKLYEITDGGEVLISDNLSAVSGATVTYAVTGLTDKTNHQYKLVFSFDGKDDTVWYIASKADETTEFSIGSWTMYRHYNSDVGISKGSVTVDGGEAHTGSASVKFVCDMPTVQNNVFLRLNQHIGMTSGKKYRISFWAKGKNVTYLKAYPEGTKYDSGEEKVSGFSGDIDWTKYEYDYTYSGKNNIMFIVEQSAEAIWLDDVECYELDDDGNPTGSNLVYDSGFEGIKSAAVAKVSDLTAQSELDSVTLKWKIPSGDYAGAAVYQKVFGEYEYRGTLNADISELKIDGLDMGSEYSFKIAAINSGGVEGEAQEVTVEVKIPDYIVNRPVLKKDGAVVSEISGKGNYTVTVSAKNNGFEDGFEFEQLVAVYDGKRMEKLYSKKQTVPQKHAYASYTDNVCEFSITEDGDYSVEVYVIDSRENLNLLNKPVFY